MRTIQGCGVAVVGGAGFLGSHLVDLLVQRECRVLVIDNLVTGRREFINSRADFEHHDITTSELRMRNLFQKYGCDYVFNYAAMPYIPLSFVRPLYVFQINAFAALMVINAAQEAGVKGILQVSSAEIYGGVDHKDIPPSEGCAAIDCKIDETALVVPHSSYGAAKAAIDSMVQVRWREAQTPCIALRQFNCLGERETHPYVVPEIISQLDKQRWLDVVASNQVGEGAAVYKPTQNPAVVKLGNNSFRDFQYAGDAVQMAVELLERGSFGEVYNMGSESGVKIYDLAVMIGKLMGFAGVRVERDESRVRPWEIWHLQSDNTKLYKALDISVAPLTPLEEALKRTIAWFDANGRRWPWER